MTASNLKVPDVLRLNCALIITLEVEKVYFLHFAAVTFNIFENYHPSLELLLFSFSLTTLINVQQRTKL